MSEDEKQLVKKFKNLYTKDFNNEHITSNDRLSYIECVLLTELIEKLEKELQQEKKKNKELEKYKTYYEEMEEVNKKFISADKIREAIEVINKQIDEAIDCSKGGLDGDFIKKGSELLAQKRILQSLLLVKEEK